MRISIFVLALWMAVGQAGAATYVVDNTQDSVFAAFTQCTSAPNDCSFRGAAGKVNANPDADVIEFNIPAATDPGCVAATGICTFTPTVPSSFGLLFTSVVTIDGLTQPGASANTLAVPAGVNMEIKIQFQQNTSSQGIFHFRNSATLRGIATSGNPNETIQTTNRHIALGELFQNAATPDFNFLRSYAIESCILGYNLNTNSVDYVEPNGSSIVELDNPTGAFVPGVGVVPYTGPINLQLGGVLPAQRNWLPSPRTLKVPSSNWGANIKAPFIVNVDGNLFGSTKDGNTPLATNNVPWDQEQVSMAQPQNPLSEINIGGSDPRKRNVFLRGVYIGSVSSNFGVPYLSMGTAPNSAPNFSDVNPKIKVQGNYFGVAANGVSWFNSPAAFSGVGFVFGGIAPGEGNITVRNQNIFSGVRLDPIIRTTYLGNTHFDYAGPGLLRPQLSESTYDPNDLNDVDAGAQNFPKIIASTFLAPNQLQVRYLIDSAPANSVYPILVEFYKATGGNDASVLLGRNTYTGAEAQTEKTVLFTLDPGVTFAADDIVLASSTPSDGGTSIFNWFPMFMSHLGNNQIQMNSPTTFTVQALADGPYAPRGVVKISVYDTLSPFFPTLWLTCNATFQPIGVGQSQASCAVPPGNNPIFSNPLVTFNLRAEFEIQESPFASETGSRIAITRPVTVFRNDLFCHGFEDGSNGSCRALP
jgi:hypothetical protein